MSDPSEKVDGDAVITTNLEDGQFHPTKLQSTVTIAGCYIANFSDGFQNTISNPTNVVFAHLLGSGVNGYSSEMKTRISNASTVGAILGVVVLGYTSDMYSRKSGLLFTSAIVVLGSLMSTVALSVHPAHNMLWYCVIARGIAGFGLGGEYPPSAAAGIEETNDRMKKYRGPMYVSFTTLMATTAGPILQVIYLICLYASDNNLKVTYHAVYSIATLIPFGLMLLRVFMTDSSMFHRSNFSGLPKSPRLFWLLVRRYWYRLFTTSLAFFLYDFINFPNSIMSSSIISSLVKDHDIRRTAIWQVILAVLPVPGVMIGAWLTNAIGRRWTGILGFAGYMIIGFIIGGLYDSLSKHIAAFVVVYGIWQAVGHMGPGATIGLICTESYPTAMRGMGYAVATAFGRTGAAVGTECFTPLENNYGKASTFYLGASIAILGIVVYFFLPESGDIDLEEEDRLFEEYLAEHGYHIEKN